MKLAPQTHQTSITKSDDWEMPDDIAARLSAVLERALRCHSPSGAEAEIDAFLHEEASALNKPLERDAAGNLYVRIGGKSAARRILVAAHKDELGMLVRAIDRDGVLHLQRLNGATAWVYGEGPVDILGRKRLVTGILGFGSRHVTTPSPLYRLQTEKVVDWSDARVETKLSAEALSEAGVGVGSRVVIARARKVTVRLPGEFVAAYALDNRAAMSALILLLGRLSRPRYDTWLAFPANEEIGAVGASYLASHIAPTDVIALEILPLSDQCVAEDPHRPYLLARDGYCIYDEELNDEIRDMAMGAKVAIGISTLDRFGSDASIPKKHGHVPRAACLCVPTLNSHGFEIASLRAIAAMVGVLPGLFSSKLIPAFRG